MIGLFSAPRFRDRLQLCEETWIPDAREAGQKYLVIQTEAMNSDERLRLSGDRLLLNLPDSLAALPQHVRTWCEFMLRLPDWDYLFKCDDDTYISIPRFMAYDLRGRDYVGAWCQWWGESYCHGGAGYFLSRRAATILAENLTEEFGAEDLLVGRTLRNAGIEPSWEGKFIGWADEENRPSRWNQAITAHSKSPWVIRDSHADSRLNGPAPILEPRTDRATLARMARRK